jgi:DNA-binding NtrC family response regulator
MSSRFTACGVTVAARDRRFLRAAAFLLSRSGFLVEVTRRPAEILPFVERHASDVVIFDASESLAAAARMVAALAALSPQVRVLIVSEESADPPSVALRVLSKWRLEELVGEVERAYLSPSGP